MAMPQEAGAFYRGVLAATEGTPYVVTETDRGFDVSLDIVDAQWFGVLDKAGLQKLYIHHVAVPEAGVYTITDDSREIEWVAGVPTAKASASRVMGRVIELGGAKVWAFDAQGNFGVQAAYTFSSEEGRDLVNGVAGQLGLSSRRGKIEKTGLYVGILGAVGAVVTVVVLVVLALNGYFDNV